MRHLRTCAFVVVGFALSGCAEDKPKGDLPPLHPAKGKVLRGGEPAPGSLQLKPETAAPEFTNLIVNAEVGADGSFEFQTMHALSMKKAPGAPAGTYKATLMTAITPQQQNPVSLEAMKTVTINAGPNDLTIEMPAAKK